LLERFFDRFVAVEIDGELFDRAGRLGDFFLQALDGGGGFLKGSGAEEDVVWFVGFQKGFDGLVADAAVGSGYEDDLAGDGCHYERLNLGLEVGRVRGGLGAMLGLELGWITEGLTVMVWAMLVGNVLLYTTV
jgi:hypothetical protein